MSRSLPLTSALRAAAMASTRSAAMSFRAPAAAAAPRAFVPVQRLQNRTMASGPSGRATTDTSAIDVRILDGMDTFLPKENIQRISEWQAGLWERLQAEVRNNAALQPVRQKWDRSGLDMIHLLTFAARDPNLALAFNYASLLLNNSYFLENLNSGDVQEAPAALPAHLASKVEAYANGIVGSAWLWLAKTGPNSSDVDIIPTFGAGTLLVAGRSQRGREDVPAYLTPATSGTGSQGLVEAQEEGSEGGSGSSSRATAGSGSSSSQNSIYPFPLAVLSLHEHAYVGDKYGVWDRKKYARDWWKSLAWQNITISQV